MIGSSARAIEAIGDESLAREQIAGMLGIAAMDVIEVDDEGYVVTPASDLEIDRRVAIAREAAARGESIMIQALTSELSGLHSLAYAHNGPVSWNANEQSPKIGYRT